MRPTRFGVQTALLYGALVFAFLAAPYSNLFFLLLGFLTLLGLLGAWWTWRNLRGVVVELPALEPVPAQAGQVLGTCLRGPGRARFQLAVQLDLGTGRQASAQVPVLQGQGEALVRLPPLPRGLYELRAARLTSSYPLGLLEARRRFEAPRELVVYPAPAPLATTRSVSEALAESLQGATPGGGDVQPASLRDHRRGDELRAVHWRASARRGALVVREWEGGAEQGLELLLDRRCEAQALEQALSLVSALVELARTNKEVLRLHSQGLQASFGPGQRPWDEALRFLAEAQPLPLDGPAPPSVPPTVTRLPQVGGHAR